MGGGGGKGRRKVKMKMNMKTEQVLFFFVPVVVVGGWLVVMAARGAMKCVCSILLAVLLTSVSIQKHVHSRKHGDKVILWCL